MTINVFILSQMWSYVNTLRPRQDGRHFPDDTFKRIVLNENVGISNKISLKFVHKGPINNIPVLVQIMAWRRPGDKPLSEPMMVSLLTHICDTRPQWVKGKYSTVNKKMSIWNLLYTHSFNEMSSHRVYITLALNQWQEIVSLHNTALPSRTWIMPLYIWLLTG